MLIGVVGGQAVEGEITFLALVAPYDVAAIELLGTTLLRVLPRHALGVGGVGEQGIARGCGRLRPRGDCARPPTDQRDDQGGRGGSPTGHSRAHPTPLARARGGRGPGPRLLL